jgi:hypothetical protein
MKAPGSSQKAIQKTERTIIQSIVAHSFVSLLFLFDDPQSESFGNLRPVLDGAEIDPFIGIGPVRED